MEQFSGKMPRANLNNAVRLRHRETLALPRCSQRLRGQKFYCSVTPHFTCQNVEKFNIFLRKFSPDGRYLLAFGASQTTLEIYLYMGLSKIGNYYAKYCNDVALIQRTLLSNVLKLKSSVFLCSNNHRLNREFSLFTENSRFVIVASGCLIPEEYNSVDIYQVYRSNESLSPVFRMEDYAVYVVELSTGRLCDTLTFKSDRIQFSHNQAAYVYGDRLAILSLQHQVINVYSINLESGKLSHTHVVGRMVGKLNDVQELDATILQTYIQVDRFPDARNIPLQPMVENNLNMIKQRLMSYLYREALTDSRTKDDNFYAVRNFYQHFDRLRFLRMSRMQLIDENTVLIRWCSEDVILRKVGGESQLSFLMFYDFEDDAVLAVFEDVSPELLHLYDIATNQFQNPAHATARRLPSSRESSLHARIASDTLRTCIKNPNTAELRRKITRKVLEHLPICAQSYSASPYLDPELFSYDAKFVSSLERPKPLSEYPVKFFCQQTGRFLFSVDVGTAAPSDPSDPSATGLGAAASRQLVQYIFHPMDPFVISVLRSTAAYALDYTVNLHLHVPMVD